MRVFSSSKKKKASAKHKSLPNTPIPTSHAAKNKTGFAESVFNDLDDTERAPGGSLFGCDITNPQPGTTTQFQELGDGVSMVTKTTIISTRERIQDDSHFLVSRVHISAGDTYPHQPSNPAINS